MSRKSQLQQNFDLEIFQTFTDLMSNAFMIMSFFFLLLLIQSFQINKKLQRLQAASPLIIDEKSGQFKFKSGSAELSPALKQYIAKNIIPQVEEIIKDREIDFIQVIGHTDGQGVGTVSNLDKNLEKVAKSQEVVVNLQPGSNTDLGLMRALAVVQELERTGRLKKVKFRAYSAAQLYLPSGELAPVSRTSDENRRRIEIRFIPPPTKER
jgi:outer membrane protein OmpA-like peptidoglycan-associated protein